MSTIHELKSWPEFFGALNAGIKHSEVRLNDRNYQHGDDLLFREWHPDMKVFTGQWCLLTIINIYFCPGLLPGYVVLELTKNILVPPEKTEAPLTPAQTVALLESLFPMEESNAELAIKGR